MLGHGCKLEEVVAHNGEADGLAKMLTRLANGLRKELPICLAVVIDNSLSPDRSAQYYEVGEAMRLLPPSLRAR
jgi:hypothetical protein